MTPGPPVPPADVAAVLDAVALVALRGLPAAVAVSVTLVNDAGSRTAAATSPWADSLDRAQQLAGSGPGVDAAITGDTCVMVDAASEPRWPAFVAAALARGALSSLSIPIPVDDDGVVGSLNAFAVGTHGFTEGDERTLTRLAGTAAAALMTADIGSYLSRSRAVIDQARGVLMNSHGCSAVEAVDRLRRTATDSGHTLRETAVELVRSTGT